MLDEEQRTSTPPLQIVPLDSIVTQSGGLNTGNLLLSSTAPSSAKRKSRKFTEAELAAFGKGSGVRLNKRLVHEETKKTRGISFDDDSNGTQEDDADIPIPEDVENSPPGTPLATPADANGMLDEPPVQPVQYEQPEHNSPDVIIYEQKVTVPPASAGRTMDDKNETVPKSFTFRTNEQKNDEEDNDDALEPPQRKRRLSTEEEAPGVWHPKQGQVFAPGTYKQELYPENRVGSVWNFVRSDSNPSAADMPIEHCVLVPPPPPPQEKQEKKKKSTLLASQMLQYSGPQVDYIEQNGEILIRKDSSPLYKEVDNTQTWMMVLFAIWMLCLFVFMIALMTGHPTVDT